MEVVKQNLSQTQTQEDAKHQAKYLAEGMLGIIGFFNQNNVEKLNALAVTTQILEDLKINVDMGFSTNFHLYFLSKFLKYTIQAMNLGIINENINHDFEENNNNNFMANGG